MKKPSGSRGTHALLLACLLGAASTASTAYAQAMAAPAATAPSADPRATLRQMVGEWNVEQRTWDGPDSAPMRHPDTVASRRLVGGLFVEEMMQGTFGPDKQPFTRVAYFNYNQETQRFEAVSMDIRAPQMMYEKSYETGVDDDQTTIKLMLEDDFVIPVPGDKADAAFKSRKEIRIANDRQVVRLYFTPLAVQGAKEFLATEYVYTRRR